jgi:2-keto-3-deoxy-L-rhamnonate aldolase RhmA
VINRRAIRLKEKLRAGEMSPGIWLSLPSPTACEVVAEAGLDWVIVDAEHSPFNPETLQHMLMGFKGSETVPVVRVPWNDAVMIKQALDMGWDGVLVPQVSSAEEARRAVAACRYPPIGNRGYGPRRAGSYFRDWPEYNAIANDLVICAIQIESLAGAAAIEDIVQVPGLDWIWTGPCDMSGTTDCFLDLENPVLWDNLRRVFGVAHAAGIPSGNPLVGVNTIDHQRSLGCQLVVLGEDTAFLQQAVDRAVADFREYLARRGG